jgi:hypothetical protein
MTGLEVMNQQRIKNRAARLKKAGLNESDRIQFVAERISYIRNQERKANA